MAAGVGPDTGRSGTSLHLDEVSTGATDASVRRRPVQQPDHALLPCETTQRRRDPEPGGHRPGLRCDGARRGPADRLDRVLFKFTRAREGEP